MKVSRIVLVFASLLLAGLFSEAAYAACPCAVAECTAESNPPQGFNGCTTDVEGLVATDGRGCVEITPVGENCTACVAGAVQGTADGNVVLARGTACTANPLGGWNCISTAGVEVDPETGTPTVDVPPVTQELGIPGDGTSFAEEQAAAGCTLTE